MDEMVITTVIPTHRRPVMLRQAIYSTLGQTWPHLRACVYDNASGDDTEEVVAKISETDSRVHYYCHPENIGAYENFSFGVRQVKTPFFSLLSDDDVLLPGFYEKAMGAFREHPDAMFVGMPTLEVDEAGLVMGGAGVGFSGGKSYYRAGEAYHGMWNGSVPAIWTGYVFRREVVEGIGFVNVSAGPAADVAFIRHVLARYPGVVVPYLAGLLRVHPSSYSTRSSSQIKMNRSFWRAQAERIENDDQVEDSIRSSVADRIENMYVTGIKRSVISSLVDGRTDSAMEAVKKLRNLGYSSATYFLRLIILGDKYLPLASLALWKVALRRRNRFESLKKDINLQYESRREEFRNLLLGN